ncbi:MAG: serine/threonine-protein kinase [Polyangiales bacterium]
MPDQPAWQQPPNDVARLGPYRILAELARGGMAAVFLAMREPRQTPDGPELQQLLASGGASGDPLLVARVVEGARDIAAIKQIHAHLAHDPDFVAMLMDEARIATRIHHPNVVELRETSLGNADGLNYLAMEYVAGESLSTLMRSAVAKGQRVNPALAASVGADIAGALHAAHELRGPAGDPLELVHRDVSPQNVLIRYDGRVKLTDFGVAKAVGRLQRTQPGEIKGKLAYMAPEQAYGRAVDRRSDVYSLGVVIFELALGRRLFGGKTDAETVRNIMQHNVPRPTAVDPSFPPGLEEIILGMLQADPAQRFQSAGAVERALRAFVTSSGEHGLDLQLGELARSLEPARYRAKTELVLRELATSHGPTGAAGRPADEHGARTVVASQRPSRVATYAAPAARPAAPEPLDASEARTIPLAAQARAAVASIAPAPPRALGPVDATQPTMRRADFEPAIAAANAANAAIAGRETSDPTSPEFANPVSGFERTMAAGNYATPGANADPGIGQTLVGAVPQHVYDQIANAPPPPQQQPHHSLPPPPQPQGAIQSMPPQPPGPSLPPPRPFQTPPPEAPRSSKGLWAAVAVGMVLFVVAALVVLTRLH